MLDHDFWVTLQDGGQWATGRQGLCTSSCVCGPKRPLNTSGTEQDAGFAQEDLTIYDRRDKTEEWRNRVLTHWLLLHPSVSMLSVNNPKCTTWTPPSLFPLSAALEHPRGDFSLAQTNVWGHSAGWLQAAAQWVLMRSKQAWLLILSLSSSEIRHQVIESQRYHG